MKNRDSRRGVRRILFILLTVTLIYCCLFNAAGATDYSFDIEAEQRLTLDIESFSINYFKFVPEKSGFYTFTSFSDADTRGYLYSSDKGTCLAEDDDSGEDYNFLINIFLEKDKVYYWAMKFSAISESGTVSFLVSFDRPPEDCVHSNTTVIEGKAPDCTTEGYTESLYCNDCYSVAVPAQTIPATNHPNPRKVDGEAATCLEQGLTDGLFCDDCQQWLTAQSVIEKTDHKPLLMTSDKATCLSDGLSLYGCIYCLEITEKKTPALGHNYELTEEIKATYTSEGCKIFVCSRCKDVKTVVTEEIIPLGEPENLTVAYVSDKKIKIKWSKTKGAECYRVSYKAEGGSWKVQTTFNNYFVLTDAQPSTDYSFRVRAVAGSVEGDDGATLSQKTRPSSASFTKISTESNVVSLSWTKAKGADGYQILISDRADFSKYRKVTIVNGAINSCEIDSLSYATEYYVKIRAYNNVGEEKLCGYFSEVSKTVTGPKRVSSLKASAKENQIAVSWKGQKNISGYQIDFSLKSDFSDKKTLGIKDGTAVTATLKKLVSGQKYYLRVRAYKIVDGKRIYGQYSETLAATTLPSAVKLSGFSRKTTQITLKWKGVTGASGYQLIYSGSKDFSNKKVIDVSYSKLKRTISALKSGKSYYFKIRAYKKLDGKTYYGAFSSVKRITTLPGGVSFTSAVSDNGKVILSWKKADSADGYEIYFSENKNMKNSKRLTVKGGNSLRKTFKALSVGKVYYFRIRSYKAVGKSRVTGKYSEIVKVRVLPQTVSLSSVTAFEGAAELLWKTVSDADGYQISYSLRSNFSDSVTVNVKGGKKNSFRLEKLIRGQKYYIRIRAYKDIGKTRVYGKYSNVLKTVTKPAAVNILSFSQQNKALKIRWISAENVSGYEIEYSLSADFSQKQTVTVSSASATSRDIKGLPAGKTYYFRMRAYKTADGTRHYGAYGKTALYTIKQED